MNILIVDDSKAMRMIIRRTLRQAGFGNHDVREASSVAEALEILAEYRASLILSDWNMPDQNGLEFLTLVRKKRIPGIFGFITSLTSSEIRAQAMEEGASFLIKKPFTVEDFQETLRDFLG